MGDTSIYIVGLDTGKPVRVTLPNVVRRARIGLLAEERCTCPGMLQVRWFSPVRSRLCKRAANMQAGGS